MNLKTLSAGTTRTAIAGFLMLFGLVVLLYFRNGLIAAIAFAVAIILGRKEVKRIIAKAIDRRGIGRKGNSQSEQGN